MDGTTATSLTNLSAAWDTVTVAIVSATNAVPVNTQSVTAYLVGPTVPVDLLGPGHRRCRRRRRRGDSLDQPGVCRFPVSVEYETVNGSASAGTAYTGQSTPVRVTFAAGQTEQTIYIPTNDNITNDNPATQNFYIKLENASLNVPTSAAPAGVGVEIANNASTGFAATVTMLDTVQLSENVTAATSSLAGTSPPDPSGAEGDGDVVVAVNGLFNVFTSSGQEVLSETLTKFWTNAGETPTGTPFDTHLIYDTNANRWLVVSLDTNISGGIEQAGNNVLIAVSDSASPTLQWTGMVIASNTNGNTSAYATAISLGVDELAANITIDLNNLTESILTIPTISLFPATGTPGDGGDTVLANVTSENTTGQSELSLQPTTNLTGFEPTNAVFGLDENVANTIDRFDITTEGNPQTKAIVTGPTPISVSPSTITTPPGAAQPGTSTTLNTGTDTFAASLYQVGDDIWAVQTVADPTTGNSDIQWFEISYSTDNILQHGLISASNLDFYDPSIAANSAGQVVIGFGGSGSSTDQFASAYAVMGTTTNGVTTFTSPILLKQGVADYNVSEANPTGGTASNQWGNYSDTVVSSDSPTNTFYTFQEYASAANQWSVGFFAITFGVPTQTQPTVTLSASGASINENGTNSVTVTATLSAVSSIATTIDLGYSGSAIANVAYTISNPGAAAGNSAVQIVIPAGSLTGSVVLTGKNNASVTGGETVEVSIVSVDGSVPATSSQVVLSIANQTPPQVSIENLTVVENGATQTADVVVRLSSASSNTVTVAYTFANGSALNGTDFSVPASDTGTLTFAPGVTEATIPVNILVNPAATGALQFSVSLSTPSNATLSAATTGTVTLVEDNPEISIEDTSVVDTSPTTAQLTVQLSQPVASPVTVNFQTTGGTAIPGTNYISESNSVFFAAGTTTETIDIPILGDTDQTQTETFNVVLSDPSFGTIERSTATVTLFNVQPGSQPPDEYDTASGETDFTADTSASGPFAPADPSGAVGPNDLVVFDSDTYQAFNKSTGSVLQTSTLNQFWTSAGITLGTNDYVGQPHVVYDPSTGRWYASALDQSIPPGSDGPAAVTNNILLAVSKTSDPTQGWVGFEFAVDTSAKSGRLRYAWFQ